MQRRTSSIGIANGILSAAISGLFLTLAKITFNKVSVIYFSFVVMATTNLFFLAYLLARGKGAELILEGKSYPELYLVGFLASALNLMENWGLRLSSPVNAGILMRGDLLFSLLIGYLLWQEKLRPAEWLGMGAMLVGISMVLQISISNVRFGSLGDVLLLGSAFLLAVNAEIIKYRLYNVDNIIVAYFNSGVCAIFFFTLAVITKEILPIPRVGMSTWLLLMACIWLQVIAYPTYYCSLRDLPTWLARVLCLVTPIVTILASAVWLREKITSSQIWGIFLVAAGIVLMCWVQQKSSKEREKLK
ncbi:DMT family transporter [Neomoorella thermoacetica]|uniref:DMT family transporter n=1 Tax=Neomoorella thermoacetica TaxID=1525 RepID=UPI0030CBD060